ncbi:hypothetical protein [Pseudomonas sp. GWSMS-1]|uniref:hypothetical protein n=1 Tax=Pseudomonas sp. GWSMS-1 TaxID=3308997 RepID=UPI003CF98EBB
MELASSGPNHLWFTISTGSEFRTKAFTLDEFCGMCAAWSADQADIVEADAWHADRIEAMRDAERDQGVGHEDAATLLHGDRAVQSRRKYPLSWWRMSTGTTITTSPVIRACIGLCTPRHAER